MLAENGKTIGAVVVGPGVRRREVTGRADQSLELPVKPVLSWKTRIIQIRDVESEADNNNLTRWPPSLPLRAFDEFIAPILGALRARESAMTFHNDRDLVRITNGFITTVVIENPNRSVLSWSLTRRQASEMLDYFEKHPTSIATQRLVALRDWWLRPPSSVVSVPLW